MADDAGTGLAEGWLDAACEALVEGGVDGAAHACADSAAEAMLNAIGRFLDAGAFDARFELAVRSWALHPPGLMERVNASDLERIEVLASTLAPWGHGQIQADARGLPRAGRHHRHAGARAPGRADAAHPRLRRDLHWPVAQGRADAFIVHRFPRLTLTRAQAAMIVPCGRTMLVPRSNHGAKPARAAVLAVMRRRARGVLPGP